MYGVLHTVCVLTLCYLSECDTAPPHQLLALSFSSVYVVALKYDQGIHPLVK